MSACIQKQHLAFANHNNEFVGDAYSLTNLLM